MSVFVATGRRYGAARWSYPKKVPGRSRKAPAPHEAELGTSSDGLSFVAFGENAIHVSNEDALTLRDRGHGRIPAALNSEPMHTQGRLLQDSKANGGAAYLCQ